QIGAAAALSVGDLVGPHDERFVEQAVGVELAQAVSQRLHAKPVDQRVLLHGDGIVADGPVTLNLMADVMKAPASGTRKVVTGSVLSVATLQRGHVVQVAS